MTIHPFPARPDYDPEPMPRVNITGCLTGSRVWLFGKPYRDFVTLSNAARCASALMTLDALGALPGKTEQVA